MGRERDDPNTEVSVDLLTAKLWTTHLLARNLNAKDFKELIDIDDVVKMLQLRDSARLLVNEIQAGYETIRVQWAAPDSA